mgnify:CR=1 FL=1
MQKSTFSFPVRFALAGLVWTLALAGALVACSRTDDAAKPSDAPTSAAIPANAYDLVAKQGRGFTVGALMSANPVYVLFDPQCPHCGHLWQQSQALHKKVKFVWIPTSFGKPQSLPQGVTLLAAANPLGQQTNIVLNRVTHQHGQRLGTGKLISREHLVSPRVPFSGSRRTLHCRPRFLV